MTNVLRKGLLTISALLVAFAVAPVAAEPVAPAWMEEPEQATGERRIVAIGDLHGDHDAFRAIVEAAGLVDGNGAWIGGYSILVQTGDVPDRGPDTLLILRDLMRLQGEAALAGGAVIPLIGNHEAMNVVGDLRYLHEGEYAAFRTENSERARRQFYRDNQDLIERAYRRMQADLSEDQIRRLWLRNTPLGGAELMDAFGPEGEIGQWLARNRAVALIDGTLFAHGGVSELYARIPIAEINSRVATAIVRRDNGPDSILFDPMGPLWYRGYFLRGPEDDLSLLPPEEAAREVDIVLAAYGADRMVVGHTPSLGGIRILLDGRLIGIDTGISAHYGGVRSYLEIRGDTVVAYVVGEGGSP